MVFVLRLGYGLDFMIDLRLLTNLRYILYAVQM